MDYSYLSHVLQMPSPTFLQLSFDKRKFFILI